MKRKQHLVVLLVLIALGVVCDCVYFCGNYARTWRHYCDRDGRSVGRLANQLRNHLAFLRRAQLSIITALSPRHPWSTSAEFDFPILQALRKSLATFCGVWQYAGVLP